MSSPACAPLNRAWSRRLQAAGVTQAPPETRQTLSSRADAAITKVKANVTMVSNVLWYDNWRVQRYPHDPRQTYLEINCCAAAVLQTGSLPPFPGYPPLKNFMLMSRVAANIQKRHYEVFKAMVQDVKVGTLQRTDFRVPLDLVRTHVRSLQWTNLGVFPHDMKSQVGLVSMLAYAKHDVLSTCRAPLPLLVDINLHYRQL